MNMSYSKAIVVMAALLVAGTVLAGNTRYIGTGNWANSGTAPGWDSGVPGASDEARVLMSHKAIVQSGNEAVAGFVRLGDLWGWNGGHVVVNSGGSLVAGRLVMGSNLPNGGGTASFIHEPYYRPDHLTEGSPMLTPSTVMMEGDYKLIAYHDGTMRLYDLSKDIGEQNDLCSAMPERVGHMKKALAKWRVENVPARYDTSANPRGRSLRPLFEGKKEGWRDTLGVESQIGWMVTDSEGHKLIEYDYPYNGKVETQLLDLKADPYEMRHFPRNDGNAKTWAKLEKAMDEWFPELHRRNKK